MEAALQVWSLALKAWSLTLEVSNWTNLGLNYVEPNWTYLGIPGLI